MPDPHHATHLSYWLTSDQCARLADLIVHSFGRTTGEAGTLINVWAELQTCLGRMALNPAIERLVHSQLIPPTARAVWLTPDERATALTLATADTDLQLALRPELAGGENL